MVDTKSDLVNIDYQEVLMERRFHTLRVISTILKILAWIIAIFTVIGFIAIIASLRFLPGQYGAGAGILPAFLSLILGAVVFVGIYAGAEIIRVLLAIEENTRMKQPE